MLQDVFTTTYFASVGVHRTEPVSEFFVVLSIGVQCAHGVTDDTEALAICEAFEKSAKLRCGLLQTPVRLQPLTRILAFVLGQIL